MLTCDENALFNTLYEPTSDEFAGMVTALLSFYNDNDLALLTDTTPSLWRRYACGKLEPCRLVKRAIWLLYMVHEHPGRLVNNKMTLFTWGKNCGALPKLSQLTVAERRKLAANFVAHIKSRGMNYSAEEIAALCGVPLAVVREACQACGYSPTQHDIIDVYTAGSVWYKMDWRKSDERLARDHKLTPGAIALARRRLSEMPSAIVAANIYHTEGSDFDWFWCLWNDAKQIEVYNAALNLKSKSEHETGADNIFIDSH